MCERTHTFCCAYHFLCHQKPSDTVLALQSLSPACKNQGAPPCSVIVLGSPVASSSNTPEYSAIISMEEFGGCLQRQRTEHAGGLSWDPFGTWAWIRHLKLTRLFLCPSISAKQQLVIKAKALTVWLTSCFTASCKRVSDSHDTWPYQKPPQFKVLCPVVICV